MSASPGEEAEAAAAAPGEKRGGGARAAREVATREHAAAAAAGLHRRRLLGPTAAGPRRRSSSTRAQAGALARATRGGGERQGPRIWRARKPCVADGQQEQRRQRGLASSTAGVARSARSHGVKSGWLLKEGTFNRDKRRPRWCELSRTGELKYYLSEGGSLKGTLQLRGAQVAIVPPVRIEVRPRENGKTGFSKLFTGGNLVEKMGGEKSCVYCFEADAAPIAAAWHEALVQAAAGKALR